jgi:archaellum component FlaC|tara:strand:- start:108 stop:290 length:183 start_codon:yes stop_codon:yes gene_type:complete
MDNMFKENIIVDIGNLTGGVKSHMDGEKYTLKQMLVRIEELEQTVSDMKYFLANPKKLNY